MNFFAKKDGLPTHGGSQRDNGISGIPVVNKSVALSVFWVVASIAVFVFGIWHCRANSYSYSLKCDPTDCVYTSAFKGPPVVFNFPKSDLIDAELARVDKNGEFMDAEQMRKMKMNRAGYTVRFRVRLPVEENSVIKVEKAIIFAPSDMGRRDARNGVTNITKYIHSAKTDKENADGAEKDTLWNKFNKNQTVNLKYGRSITAFGAISAFLAVVSLAASFMLGTWSETTRRTRLKKAS